MKFSKKTKTIFISVAVVFLGFAAWVAYNAYTCHYKIIWEHQKERDEKFSSIERSFNNNPNIHDAGILIDWYYNEKKDATKSLFYANECIRLGVNDTPVGYLVNYSAAAIYQSIGNKTLARKHLRMAIRLDKDKIILKNNWIENGILNGVLSVEEIKSPVQD
jgi:tetratricopeptide (TPR) repeat protein